MIWLMELMGEMGCELMYEIDTGYGSMYDLAYETRV